MFLLLQREGLIIAWEGLNKMGKKSAKISLIVCVCVCVCVRVCGWVGGWVGKGGGSLMEFIHLISSTIRHGESGLII